MKTTDHFKRTIQMYLEQRAAEDALFAKNYRNPAKNIDDCVTYILNYVQKSGCNGFTDGEIYGQAVHYYDENEIEVGKPIQCQIAVNHVVELTAEEKDWLTRNVNSNTYFKSAVPLQGWRFDFSDVLRTFIVCQYGHWTEYKATDKTGLRRYLYGRIDNIVELEK